MEEAEYHESRAVGVLSSSSDDSGAGNRLKWPRPFGFREATAIHCFAPFLVSGTQHC